MTHDRIIVLAAVCSFLILLGHISNLSFQYLTIVGD